MAVTWITPAGDLGTLEERITVNIVLQASTDIGNLQYKIIAGSLPTGLYLDQATGAIKGTPGEVTKFTEKRFVVRAYDAQDEKDRTFKLFVDGSDFPEWITQEGFLKVGEGEAYFVLDDSRVDFQLEATDRDLVAGDVLQYYVIPNSGTLPPGLTLSKTGRITGFTEPVAAIDYTSTPTGAYDTHSFDTVPLDIAKNNSTGFDSYYYDDQRYDYGEQGRTPKKLSRIYTFGVAITDGVNAVSRTFKIYVVTEEFLQADNTLIQVDTNLFQADSSRDRKPLWITDSNLGRYRANNYVTIFLDVYDPPSLTGTISYFLLETNPDDGTPSVLPPGLVLDGQSGELAGKIPYQAAVTENYKFSMEAVNFPPSLAQGTYNLRGNWSSTTAYAVNDAIKFGNLLYVCVKDNIGEIPEDNEEYWNLGVSSAVKTFTVDIIGEIESAIEWISNTDVGTIKPNQPSRLFVEARSLLYGGRIRYELVSGEIPPGLTFLPTGILQGKVRQFSDSDQDGLTRFYDQDSALIDSTGSRSFNTTFDDDQTSYDKIFNFKVKAIDGANFAESEKDFTIKVVAENEKTFSNLYCKALQSKEKRFSWFNFITDGTVFVPEDMYRYGDENFGVQAELKTLLFAGIESVEAVRYIQAMSRNHYRKRFTFGDLRSAKAKDPETQETIYEAIYIDLKDEYEKEDGTSINAEIELKDNINSKVLVSQSSIRIDSDIPLVSDSDLQKVFPNSVKNMRGRIRAIGERDREFLPLWMRSIQDTGTVELGYTKALVLCYTKPGRSESIMAKIRAKGFDFKLIDFVADRYIIDIVNGEIQDQYLKFPQESITKQNESYPKTQDISI